jgi:hypothetical protein
MPVELDLHHALRGFTGTDAYHRHWLRHVVLTDGVAYLMEHGNCYWLVDAIASHLRRPSVVAKTRGERFASFHLWELRKLPPEYKNAASLEARADSNEPTMIRQLIPYTDFPFENGDKPFKLYAAASELEEGKTVYVLMLPSEY